MGRAAYPDATELFITADAGGSNEALTSLGALGRLTSAAGWRLNAKTRVTKRLWLSIAAYLCLAVAMIGIGYVLNRALDHGNGG